MSERQSLEAARRRLVAALSGIVDHATSQATERCPYRALDDRCTFPAGCRNQRPNARQDGFRCSGDRLDPAPAVGDAAPREVRP